MAGKRGATLIEVLVGSLIGAVLIAGLMAAFLTALRVSSHTGGGMVEAASYAQQTLEHFRNRVACDDAWFNAACAPAALPSNANDALPAGALFAAASSTAPTRTYTVTPADCDGDGATGDCFKVVTKVSWTPPQ